MEHRRSLLHSSDLQADLVPSLVPLNPKMAENRSSSDASLFPSYDIDITPILVGIITLIAIAIAILFTLILIIWYLRCRQMREARPKPAAESKPENVESSRHSPAPTVLRPPYTRRRAQLNLQEDISVLFELVNARANQVSVPAKLEHPPHCLQPNPMYSSTDNIGTISAAASWGPESPTASNNNYELAGPSEYEYNDDLLHSYASICYDESYEFECVPSSTDVEPESPLQFTPENICELHSLGEGQFGQVVLAETIGVSLKDLWLSDNDDRNVSLLVAVKKLKRDAGKGVRKAFEREIQLMSHFNHKNIVRLLGVCLNSSTFMIMEHMENGDLNQYLKKHCEIPLKSPSLPNHAADINLETLPAENQIDLSTLVFMAVQVASGMEYLASMRCIHRDLATRNCLVGQNHEVKIADFGLSRTLYSSHYYKLTGRAVVPIRWMATECFYGKFSEKSDVWSFGVTLWEIFTLARQQPFNNLSNQQVICDAVRGPDRQLLPKPENCPPEVYEIMQRCWVYEPRDRATFEEVCQSLARIY